MTSPSAPETASLPTDSVGMPLTRPDVDTPGRWTFPEPTTARLDNGLTVHA